MIENSSLNGAHQAACDSLLLLHQKSTETRLISGDSREGRIERYYLILNYLGTNCKSIEMIVKLLIIVGLLALIAECQQEIAPKFVCYYTTWSKDRPSPWSYVSPIQKNLIRC